MSEYAEHLANMQDKAKVVATSDILSDNGVLLAKSGMKINRRICKNLVKFKLLKPIEDSISIENQLNAVSIYDHITKLVANDSFISAMDNSLGDNTQLKICCLRLEKFPILLQKLTVLHLEIPDVFNQALFSALLAYLCGRLNNLEQSQVEEHFLAGITHDIGFLHINYKILQKQDELTANEWRTIQSHPIIAYEILRNLEDFPKNAARAVLEHHENLDGSGYPRNKKADDLEPLGQLISLLDNVIAIYNKKFKAKERSPRCIIPVLQINMHSYLPDIASVIIRVLKSSPKSPTKSYDTNNIAELIQIAENQQTYIIKTTSIIRDTNVQLGYQHENTDILTIQNTGNNIVFIVNSAGLNDASYMDLLKELEKSDKDTVYNEIEDTLLMLGEIIYQFQAYQKSGNVFIDKNPAHTLATTLKQALDEIRQIPKPEEKETNAPPEKTEHTEDSPA